jgi:CRISPR system Cascade subunit CasB
MRFVDEHFRITARWWRRMQPLRNGAPNPTADRAALARLRRADLFGVMQDPATFVLFRDLGARHPDDLLLVALCAGALASVRDEQPEHPARTLGAPSLDALEQALMKPLRFRRLIEADNPQDRLTALRRAVAIAGGKVNVRELAAACLDWSEDRRRRWIFEYYGAGRAAPGADAEIEKTEEMAG